MGSPLKVVFRGEKRTFPEWGGTGDIGRQGLAPGFGEEEKGEGGGSAGGESYTEGGVIVLVTCTRSYCRRKKRKKGNLGEAAGA